jgi:tyrosyl-tRNA synthetase
MGGDTTENQFEQILQRFDELDKKLKNQFTKLETELKKEINDIRTDFTIHKEEIK